MLNGCSDSGWITMELFEYWLVEHFLKHVVHECPLLLLLDRHSTRYQPDVVQFAKDNDILLLCLPPHTAHEAQPLDCSVSLHKKQSGEKYVKYFQGHPGELSPNLILSAFFQKLDQKL